MSVFWESEQHNYWQRPLTELPGVGESIAAKFSELEIATIGDLLFAAPRGYLDLTKEVKITELSADQPHTLTAKVEKFSNIYLRGRGGRSMQRAMLIDDSGKIPVLWFNQPYLQNVITEGESYSFVAKLALNSKTGKPQLNSPQFEKLTANRLNSARIVPLYRLTRGISVKFYRKLVDAALTHMLNNFDQSQQGLEQYSKSLKLSFSSALEQIHQPKSQEELEAAQKRLAISELVPIQLKLKREAEKRAGQTPVFRVEESSRKESVKDYWGKMPFTPTPDQLRSTQELAEDLAADQPMYRLIQGDVGSGKTAVAGFALEACLRAGKDAVLMVPTGVLAEQHFAKFTEQFATDYPQQVELVQATTEVGKSGWIEQQRQDSKPRLFIGTQALLHRQDRLGLDLGLLVVDEEHRFGVNQRQQISELAAAATNGASAPHYLTLTATPIPRSMALGIFGNIALSRIDSLPPGRKPKKTLIVPDFKRESSYNWVREQIDTGNLVYWVCPLIEEKEDKSGEQYILEKDDKSSVVALAKELRRVYPDLVIAELHGKLKHEQKSEILGQFARGEVQILVSTTVIEVGVDVAAANIIAIESPERFGLAQLHQLRGRVGRGDREAHCLLFPSSEALPERLKVFAQEQNGLKLAEFDLQERGPGEVYGRLQSGVPQLQFADFSNTEQLDLASIIAECV